ncbi:MAG: tyrosine-type recombinase/integrase [Desulfitobacterium sp.]
MEHTTILLNDLICRAKNQLTELGYAEGTKYRYILKWKHLSSYAKNKGYGYYSNELGRRFLEEFYGIKAGIDLTASQVFKVRTITALEEILEHDRSLICHQRPRRQAPPQFQDLLNNYESQQQRVNLTRRTIEGKRITLIRFLNFLDEQEIIEITDLTSHEVLLYLHTLDKYRQATRSGILFILRGFLQFLHSEGYVKEPLNTLFPIIFSNKYERLPSYYSPDEVHSILCQVDRSTLIGRRDYLILVLAVQLGMRAGDINRLKFENIKWSRSTIELVQQKTKNLLQLPLTEELKYALADYMRNSRPEVDDAHIFIRQRAPFQPFTEMNVFYYVINKYMTMAGTNVNKRKHGLHSMRHSMASNLLQNRIPYPVITGILGHENSSTTKLYLRVDIQQLRTVALEVPNEEP